MIRWNLTFTIVGRKLDYMGDATDAADAFTQMIVEARNDFRVKGIETSAPVHVVAVTNGIVVSSTVVLDESRAVEAVKDEMLATYLHRSAPHIDTPKPPPLVRESLPLSADEMASTWAQTIELLVAHDIAPVDAGAEDGTAALARWYPDDALSEPSVRFWFENECWRYPDLLPSLVLLTPSQSVEISELWTTIARESGDDSDDDDASNQLAGQWASAYDTRFVAIADLDGTTLAVDTRSGSARGCVSEYAGAFFDESSVRWDSVGSLLNETLSALRGHQPFARRYTAAFVDRQIRWAFWRGNVSETRPTRDTPDKQI